MLSAVEGIEIVTPALKHFVIPVTLIVLFVPFVQKRGTANIGALFGPVMIVCSAPWPAPASSTSSSIRTCWAMNPLYAIEFLLSNQSMALVAMGNVVLAVTGAEALYADMGHFGRKPVQLAWYGFVLPSLVLNYFGQGALILSYPEAAKNPFYLSAPDWVLIPLVALATVATIIASQAVIRAPSRFRGRRCSLASCRAWKSSTRPRRSRADLPAGGQLGLAAGGGDPRPGFKSSNNLAAAYGIAVTGDMVITSLLATVVVAGRSGAGVEQGGGNVRRLPLGRARFPAANVLKIPDGGWFPLVAGAAVFVLMTT